MKTKYLIILYFIVVMLEIFGGFIYDLQNIPYGIWTFKPLLMPILMFWYYKETKANSKVDKIILASLFFSWWGDNFLMPAIFKTDINFLLGLGSFLIAHILYIAAFAKTNTLKPSLVKQKPYLVLPFILLGVGLIAFLMHQNSIDFQAMKIPVIIYSSVIIVMVITALNRWDKVSKESFNYVLLGAILFMVSDSIIALNKFSNIFEGLNFVAGVLIMSLYAFGQYCIIKGCIFQSKTK